MPFGLLMIRAAFYGIFHFGIFRRDSARSDFDDYIMLDYAGSFDRWHVSFERAAFTRFEQGICLPPSLTRRGARRGRLLYLEPFPSFCLQA